MVKAGLTRPSSFYLPSYNSISSRHIRYSAPPDAFRFSYDDTNQQPYFYPGNCRNSLNIYPSPDTPSPSKEPSDSHLTQQTMSAMQAYQPTLMDVAEDTLPELLPIFGLLNNHVSKIYHEGYLLKLHDLDSRGRPSSERTWNECYAQLVGTVLTLWDAAALDVAKDEHEVVPSFINVADASIKMIESLPMSNSTNQSLPNVLSMSTAANNRYLFHFSSISSLTQWVASIRLAMFENSCLQEAYTGSLVAGKGKTLNNIRQIMERTRMKQEDWARVRFGAGTPWRRCWYVVTPPDEKEYQKLRKANKKRNPYDRTAPIIQGDVKFYESRKVTKKSVPIATITNAYAAYAVYPQSRPLVDQSTLVKVEGTVTLHTVPETQSEGFVFVMPEMHPAVPGFEILLRFLFPVWDTFGLYGRPKRIIADVLDSRGLMFAMPQDKRYTYLDMLDVSALIHTEGSLNWTPREWRKRLKDITSTRMLSLSDSSSRGSKPGSYKRTSRSSLPANGSSSVRFDDSPADGNQRQRNSGQKFAGVIAGVPHRRTVSDMTPGSQGSYTYSPDFDGDVQEEDENIENTSGSSLPLKSGQSTGTDSSVSLESSSLNAIIEADDITNACRRDSPISTMLQGEADDHTSAFIEDVKAMKANASTGLEPISEPPKFAHGPSERPPTQPRVAPELARQHSGIDAATLKTLAETGAIEDTVAPVRDAHNTVDPAAWEKLQDREIEFNNDNDSNSNSSNYDEQVRAGIATDNTRDEENHRKRLSKRISLSLRVSQSYNAILGSNKMLTGTGHADSKNFRHRLSWNRLKVPQVQS